MQAISDVFIANISDPIDRMVIAIRVESKRKARRILYAELRLLWPDEMKKPVKDREIFFDLRQEFFTQKVTYLLGS